jgi:hypothetical protein
MLVKCELGFCLAAEMCIAAASGARGIRLQYDVAERSRRQEL